MSRLYLRLILMSIALLTVVLVLVRAQPYADAERQQLLHSADCSAPCFMGIRPDMPVDGALTLLKSHPWVDHIDNRTVQNSGGYIYWYWKPDAPAWIDTARRGTLWVNNRRVSQFWVDTRYGLGEWIIQLGAPDINIRDENADTGHGIYQYRGVHAADGLVIMSWQRCVTADPYRGRASLKFRSVMSSEELASMMYLNQWTVRYSQCASG